MKQFLQTYLGYPGLAINFVIATIIRIPVFVFLSIIIVVWLLIWNPITGREDTARWLSKLYNWYAGNS